MGTVITFADFYRPEPVVLSTSWLEFVLLFSSDDDQVRLRQRWDRGADRADLVLAVVQNGEDGPKGWIVRQHPESPAPMYLQCSYGLQSSDNLPWAIDTKSVSGYRIEPGKVFCFSFPPNVTRRDFGMMLHSRRKCQGEGHPASPGLVLKHSLENLPVEISKRLLSRLSVYEVMHVLPYVSTEMFKVAKGGADWKEVEIDELGRFPSSRDVTSFADIAQETCASLKMRGFHHSQGSDPALGVTEVYYALCWRAQWTNLAELNLVGKMIDLDVNALRGGLKKGNFPALKTLKLRLWKGLAWDSLEGCCMPKLVHLEISIGQKSAVNDGKAFCNQLNKLETLGIFLVEDTHDDQHFWENRDGVLFPNPGDSVEFLPRLKTLMIGGISEKAWPHFEEQVQVFSKTKVTRLCLCDHLTSAGDRTSHVIAGSWLFSTFQHLTAVNFDWTISVKWDSAPDPALQKLVHLRAFLPGSSIPFERMTSLESASVGFEGHWISLKKLVGLPSLVALKVDACVKTLNFLKPERGVDSNIRLLDLQDLVYMFGGMNGWGTGHTARNALSNLTHLFLPSRTMLSTAEDAYFLVRGVEGLVELRYSRSSPSAIQQFASLFPNRSWEVFEPVELRSERPGPCVIRAGNARPANAGDVFDDPFFAVGRLRQF